MGVWTIIDYIQNINPLLDTLIRNRIHPIIEDKKSCTLMLILNLAEPDWISVPCDQPLLENIICQYNSTYNTNKEVISPIRKICLGNSLLQNETCILFTWYLNKPKDNHKLKSTINISKPSDLHGFRPVFDAITATFPPIYATDFEFRIIYERFYNIYTYKNITISDKPVGGLYISTYEPQEPFVGDNMFLCDKTYLSVSTMCDGIIDCVLNGLDEENCTCPNMTRISKLALDIKCLSTRIINKVCTQFQNLTTEKYCKHMTPTTKEVGHTAKFPCHKGDFIRHIFVDDLVPDCGSEAEDEPKLKSLLQKEKWFPCYNSEQLPCLPGHPKCYNISEICSYKLDHNGNLYPCRTGGHIQKFSYFECNQMSWLLLHSLALYLQWCSGLSKWGR